MDAREDKGGRKARRFPDWSVRNFSPEKAIEKERAQSNKNDGEGEGEGEK